MDNALNDGIKGLNMNHLVQMKDIMRDYLRYSDEIIQFELDDLEDEFTDSFEGIEFLEDLVYKRDHCIEFISSHLDQAMFQDAELVTIYNDCIQSNSKVEEKLREMIGVTRERIDHNFKNMSNQGRDKIALKNYFKSQELDGINSFYLDKRK